MDADGVLTLRFENRMPGYPGWFWTVSLAQVDESAPTVLEAELMPGDGALIAPDWLPWAERLAEYQAAQAALAAEGLETDDLVIDEDEDEDLDDVDDLDAVDFDNDGSPILHSGDVDGVDIDELSDDAADAIDEPIIEDDAEDEIGRRRLDDDDFDDDESTTTTSLTTTSPTTTPTRTTTRTTTPRPDATYSDGRGNDGAGVRVLSRSTSSSMTFSTMRGMSTASGSSSHCT